MARAGGSASFSEMKLTSETMKSGIRPAKIGDGQIAGVQALDHRYTRVAANIGMDLAMADIDRRDMGSAALEQDLGEAAGRGADVERFTAGGIEAEMIEPANQLERGARYVALRRIIDGNQALRRNVLAGLAGNDAVDCHRATLDRVAGTRAAGKQTALDEQVVEPLAGAGWRRGVHRPSWRKLVAKARILGQGQEHRRTAGTLVRGLRASRRAGTMSQRAPLTPGNSKEDGC